LSAGDAALIDRFLEMMAAESGAAANTIAAYGSDLRLASTFLDGGLAEADAAALARLGG
jgi:integrase/recombinase XerD